MELDAFEDSHGVIEVDSDSGESDDDTAGESSASRLFRSSQQVFIVASLSKATSGYRPSVTCEGFLAELSSTTTGHVLSPLGQDHQLSFKYEPPSPKFNRKRPSCISYRLQLLHGSQFLYSLRGLPKTLRCQREFRALEWGPVHVVFSAAADMDTFLGTLKYVEVQDMSLLAGEADAQPAAAAAAEQHSVQEQQQRRTEQDAPMAPLQPVGASNSRMHWAEAAARLLAEQETEEARGPVASQESAKAGGKPSVAEKPITNSRAASASPSGRRPRPHGGALLTVRMAVLAAALGAAYLLSTRAGPKRLSG